MIPYSLSMLSDKFEKRMLSAAKGHKVFVFTLFFMIAPSGLCIAFQAARGALKDENMIQAGLVFTIGIFIKFAFVVFLFWSHIRDAAKDEVVPFWTDDWARKPENEPLAVRFALGATYAYSTSIMKSKTRSRSYQVALR